MRPAVRFTAFASFFLLALPQIVGVGRAETPQQLKNAEEWRRYHVPLGTPKCQGDILVELVGGLQLVIPRDSYFIDVNGDDIKRDLRHPVYDCSVSHLSQLSHIFANRTDMYPPEAIGRKEKVHPVDGLANARAQGASRILPSGISEIKEPGGFTLYVLPLDKAPTGDDQPVVFECDDARGESIDLSSCSTTYFLPNQMRVHYLLHWDREKSDFLEIDQEKRAFIDTAIAKAKSLTPGRPK